MYHPKNLITLIVSFQNAWPIDSEQENILDEATPVHPLISINIDAGSTGNIDDFRTDAHSNNPESHSSEEYSSSGVLDKPSDFGIMVQENQNTIKLDNVMSDSASESSRGSTPRRSQSFKGRLKYESLEKEFEGIHLEQRRGSMTVNCPIDGKIRSPLPEFVTGKYKAFEGEVKTPTHEDNTNSWIQTKGPANNADLYFDTNAEEGNEAKPRPMFKQNSEKLFTDRIVGRNKKGKALWSRMMFAFFSQWRRLLVMFNSMFGFISPAVSCTYVHPISFGSKLSCRVQSMRSEVTRTKIATQTTPTGTSWENGWQQNKLKMSTCGGPWADPGFWSRSPVEFWPQKGGPEPKICSK